LIVSEISFCFFSSSFFCDSNSFLDFSVSSIEKLSKSHFLIFNSRLESLISSETNETNSSIISIHKIEFISLFLSLAFQDKTSKSFCLAKTLLKNISLSTQSKFFSI
jgi:hypothetical protein